MLLMLENMKQCIENGLDGIDVHLGYENVNAVFPVESVNVYLTAAAIRSGEQDIVIYVNSPDENGGIGCLRNALDVVLTLANGGFDMSSAEISAASYNRSVQGFEVRISFKVKGSSSSEGFFGVDGKIIYSGGFGSVSYSFNAQSAVIELEQSFYPIMKAFDSSVLDTLKRSSYYKLCLNGVDYTAVSLILMSEPVDIQLNDQLYKHCVMEKYVCAKNSYDIVLSCKKGVETV